MITMQSNIKGNDNYTINDAMEVLLDKVSTAIDDMEAGRVISEEEMWEELDSI
jgi:hypothetical protein